MRWSCTSIHCPPDLHIVSVVRRRIEVLRSALVRSIGAELGLAAVRWRAAKADQSFQQRVHFFGSSGFDLQAR